jgi:cell division septum initiation protein DivIVA
MMNDRRRILDLALESLENKKKKIDQEIAEISREIKGGPKAPASSAPAAKVAAPKAGRKPSRFTKEERFRRSARMKAYWDNWRKKKPK